VAAADCIPGGSRGGSVATSSPCPWVGTERQEFEGCCLIRLGSSVP